MLQNVVEDCQFSPVTGTPVLEVPFQDALTLRARTVPWMLTIRTPALRLERHHIPPQKQNKQKTEKILECLQK